MSFHTEDPICPGCEKKLETAHPYLAQWFRVFVKVKYLNAHISDSFRDEAAQDLANLNHASDLHWPNSKHNRMIKNSLGHMVGQSQALDLFEERVHGVPVWNPAFYASLAKASEYSGWAIRWGGTFRRCINGKVVPKPDNPHFEIMSPIGGSNG